LLIKFVQEMFFVTSSPLDRSRHSLLEINIFSAGMNTWFLTIDHRSITNLVQDSSPSCQEKKIHSCFSLVYFAKKIRIREETLATFIERKYVKGIYKKKAQLNFTTVQSWTISCIRTFDFCPGFRLLGFPPPFIS